MTTGKSNVYWTLIVILLIVIIAVGGASVWSKYRGRQPIEISMPAVQELPGEIYIGGAVNNPGFYPLKQGDSLEALIQAAGGTTGRLQLMAALITGEETKERPLPAALSGWV